MKTWTKYTFACDPEECDTLIEVTCDNYGFPSGVMQLTCPCGRVLKVLSVADATIPPTTTKEEKMEYPYNNPEETPQVLALQEMILSKDRFIESLQEKVSEANRSATNARLEQGNYRNSVKDYLVENYDELELHADAIAEILDIELKRDVTFTVTMTARVTVSASPDEELDSLINDNLYIEAHHGDIVIDDYTVDSVEEF